MLLKDKMTSITLTRVEQDIVDYLLMDHYIGIQAEEIVGDEE